MNFCDTTTTHRPTFQTIPSAKPCVFFNNFIVYFDVIACFSDSIVVVHVKLLVGPTRVLHSYCTGLGSRVYRSLKMKWAIMHEIFIVNLKLISKYIHVKIIAFDFWIILHSSSATFNGIYISICLHIVVYLSVTLISEG